MVDFFTGKIDGRTFIAAHALVDHERITAAAAVDALSSRYGSKLPELTKSGWVIRQVAPEILPPSIAPRLELASPGHVHNVGEVALADVELFVGSEQLAKAFAAPDPEIPDSDLEAA